ncbi:hypothetical protein Tsp_00042 [Trichinella spiralis]|uniref:hypothetical protein n=1 Tax=Trichinella spiralis TaxID=6334 RepID=UPI0001EFBA55|nr:hypothetical protein Tsp_00042 [Trichinella spiralis]
MNVKLWLDRLKNYLIDCEMARSRWTRIALSFVGDDVLARLVDYGSVVADASDVQIHPNVNLRVRGLGKSPSANLDVIGTAMITIELGEVSVKHPALVVRGLGHSCLLENDFLIEHVPFRGTTIMAQEADDEVRTCGDEYRKRWSVFLRGYAKQSESETQVGRPKTDPFTSIQKPCTTVFTLAVSERNIPRKVFMKDYIRLA